MNEPCSLSGKRALITGGGTGLGRAIAGAMVAAGAAVILTGRREEPLRAAVTELGANATYRVNDVAELKGLPALVTELEAAGPIDILVNNAGINLKKDALEITDEEFERILRTNLGGLFALTREVARHMVARGQGSIIMITSMAAMYGLSKVAAYAASKSAVLGMTRTLASDLSPRGIRVNAIAPGFIGSPMLEKAFAEDPERRAKALGRTPMGRFGRAEEVGLAAVFLASDAASFITGVNLPVDGGNSIGF